jgi:hypothetical protein
VTGKAERLRRIDEALAERGVPNVSVGGRADVGGGTLQVDLPSVGDGSFSAQLRAQYHDPRRQAGRRAAKRGVIDARDVPDEPYDASHLDHDHDWLG